MIYSAGNKIQDILGCVPDFKSDHDIGIILGSGWSNVSEIIEGERITVSYSSLPHFPQSTVPGHTGNMISGKCCGRKTLIFQGRTHYYEGHNSASLSIIPELAYSLGIKTLICTNASGSLSPRFQTGDIVIINDHINLLPFNPLMGRSDGEKSVFLDMSHAYSPRLIECAKNAAKRVGIKIYEGVFAAVMGPSYETPAETRFLRLIGADMVAMSTIPEVIMSNYLGVEVLGLSCIANTACSDQEHSISHDVVLNNIQNSQDKIKTLIREIVKSI